MLRCKVSVERVKRGYLGDVTIVQARSASSLSLSIENGAKAEVAVSKRCLSEGYTYTVRRCGQPGNCLVSYQPSGPRLDALQCLWSRLCAVYKEKAGHGGGNDLNHTP